MITNRMILNLPMIVAWRKGLALVSSGRGRSKIRERGGVSTETVKGYARGNGQLVSAGEDRLGGATPREKEMKGEKADELLMSPRFVFLHHNDVHLDSRPRPLSDRLLLYHVKYFLSSIWDLSIPFSPVISRLPFPLSSRSAYFYSPCLLCLFLDCLRCCFG
jgi:hypothetical protein